MNRTQVAQGETHQVPSVRRQVGRLGRGRKRAGLRASHGRALLVAKAC